MDAQLVVLADDLSGAAETAAALGRGSTVVLWRAGTSGHGRPDGVNVVVDTATRASSEQDAGRVIAEVASHQPRHVPIMLKVDSLLRSHAAEIAALKRGRTVVVCPALPALGRSVRGGRMFIGDRPLDETDAWRLERRRPPGSLADWLHPLPVERIGLEELRSGEAPLSAGRLHICDAETDSDLALVGTLAARAPNTLLAGSAAAVAAGATALGIPRSTAGDAAAVPPFEGVDARGRGVLLVVGTGAEPAREQVIELTRAGVTVVTLSASADDAELDLVRAALAGGRTVAVTWANDLGPDVEPMELSARLATRLAPAVRATGADLFLTGGQTARSVLDELDVGSLTVLTEVAHGVVISFTSEGRLVGTRPGSFGGPGALVDVVAALVQQRLASDQRPSQILED